MFRLKSLRHRVLLLFAILALGPLLALGLLDYVNARRAVERIIVDQTTVGARRAAAMILDRYALIQSDALLLSENAETQDLFAALATGDSGRIKVASASLDTFARTVWATAGSSYLSIELRDRGGNVLVRLPENPQPPGVAQDDNLTARAVSRIQADSERKTLTADEGLQPLEFAIERAAGTQILGRLVMHPRAATILPAQLRNLAFGRAGYLLVIDSLQRTIYDSRGGGSGLRIAEIIRSNTGNAVVRYAAGDSARLASAEIIPALGWTVLSSAAISEFAAGLNSARLLGLALVIAVAAGVGIAFTILIGRSTRSLEELTLAAKAVGHGDLVPRLPAASDDEVGMLAGAFDQMLGRVRTTMREIEVSRQLAVLGEFSAQLAHEIRNPLTSLKLNLQALSRDLHRVGSPGTELEFAL